MTTNLVSWIGWNMGLMLTSSSVNLKVETLTPIYLASSIFRTQPVVQNMKILFLELCERISTGCIKLLGIVGF
jgi:hypothetical protein